MLIPFEELEPSSRIWVYQSSKTLSEGDQQVITEAATTFFNQWQAHGKDLKCGFRIAYDQFLVLGVDEDFNAATGCSIDASVHLVKQLEQELGVNFFDRMQIPFLKEGKVNLYSMQQLTQTVAAGEVQAQSVTFNNLVSTKAEFDTSWQVPAAESWLSRYF